MTTSTEVRIADVPWPAHKLLALAVGILVFVAVGLFTASAGPAVLSAAAAAALIGLGHAVLDRSDV
ncbi:hypothetical protein TUM20985_30870 [Mycobacterium antarcticum]|uniref:hypothetical protein n=1 Tax=unclassified Mycolicibacterium TaxID=2636767 RepID=UPI002399663A|nr:MULTISPECIES: hypothetical protein [unclassified Mycolicibacterium]BDX32540.1 hypothetical protein TUM20985_30870 [Mycolicibacterium sp. TUM20985]GLP75748.1 hypothetical protein TUM20983_28580 [Mycolicibacterium sp. TUM20983]GLP83910.1 hypothetical protein TUM20984_53300 [Mycolicibacterium sp. TUM20984]